MGKNNEPKDIKRDSTADPATLFNLRHYETTITDSDDATYTGVGRSEEEADRKAGEKYQNGDSD